MPAIALSCQRVVDTNDKKRFELSEDGTKIRARQGHSVKIELGLEPLAPPDLLFHGTATKTLPVILNEGLKPMNRHHVHLSEDTATAVKVGRRHGKPAVLKVLGFGHDRRRPRLFPDGQRRLVDGKRAAGVSATDGGVTQEPLRRVRLPVDVAARQSPDDLWRQDIGFAIAQKLHRHLFFAKGSQRVRQV